MKPLRTGRENYKSSTTLLWQLKTKGKEILLAKSGMIVKLILASNSFIHSRAYAYMFFFPRRFNVSFRKVNLDIKMKLEKTAVYNVIGNINGQEEPGESIENHTSSSPMIIPFLYVVRFVFQTDRLVLLGNHRDSWIFGAADASSGTAALMELSMRVGEMRKKGNVISLWFGGFGRFRLVVSYVRILHRVETTKDHSAL